MVEMILVLFVITVLLTASVSHGIHQGNLRFFMLQLQDYYLQLRLNAVQTRSTRSFEIQDQTLILDHTQVPIPIKVSCDPQSFLIYPSGKVNHAGTVVCYSGKHVSKLVIQLGSGHVQIK